MKKIGLFLISNVFMGIMPSLAWASGGHARGSGSLAQSIGSSSQTLIFLAMIGNVIVLSMVIAEIIRSRRERGSHGTQQESR